MNLQVKVTLLLVFVTCLSVASNYAAMQTFVFPSFVSLEHEQAVRNIERVQRAIDRDLEILGGFAEDWGHWDHTYEFAAGEYEDYRAENIYLDAFTGFHANIVYYYNADGEVIVEQLYDFDAAENLETEGFTLSNLPRDHWLLQPNDQDMGGVKTEIISTSLGPALVGAATILTSKNQGPPGGTLVFGRILTESEVGSLRARTNVDFSVWPSDSTDLAAAEMAIWEGLAGSDRKIAVEETHEDTLSAYATLNDPTGKPIVFLRADSPTDITMIGDRALNAASVWMICAGLITIVITLMLLRFVVVAPTTRLADLMVRVGQSGNLDERAEIDRRDEFGVLGSQFNSLLDNLSEARRQVAEDSYLTGMAETAAGVMHNVRNQMQPILANLGQASSFLESRSEKNVKTAVSELGDQDVPRDRKQKLLDYVDLTFDERKAGDRKLAASLREMASQVMTIDDILSQHQSAAYSERGPARASLYKALASARNVLASADEVVAVTIEPDMANLPSVRCDEIVLSQVIGNILLNAERSILESGIAGGEITVSGARSTNDDRTVVRLTISDNGGGIAPDILARMFDRGFTTKQEGKGGLGLHWCANTLSSIDGRIWAENDGVGNGAIVHVEIPAVDQLVLEPANSM